MGFGLERMMAGISKRGVSDGMPAVANSWEEAWPGGIR